MFGFAKALLIALILFCPQAQAREWLDRSSTIFFPPRLQSQIEATQVFPAFWWNFLVLDHVSLEDQSKIEEAQTLCRELKLKTEDLAQVECEPEPAEFAKVLADWASDLPLRSDLESQSGIQNHVNQVLAQASLTPGGPGLMDLLRMDPFATWTSLKELAEKRMPPLGPKLQGFYFDPEKSRLLIPVQFTFPPDETLRTQSVMNSAKDFTLIGPHGSTLENQSRIIADLHQASLIGFLMLLLFAGWLTYSKAYRVLPLFGVIGIGTGFGFICTLLVFGSVHGLTLSLGSAICGLAMDYAFQAALNSTEPKIWKSNLCGLSTTLIGLIVLMFSSMPLLRQMMFFSASGLIGSFTLCYLVFQKKPHWFETKLFRYEPKAASVKLGAIAILLALSVYGTATLSPNLSLKQFDYQNAHDREIAIWLYTKLGMKAPLFEIHHGPDVMAKSNEEKNWAQHHQIGIETITNYLPDVRVQKAHLQTWIPFEGNYKHLGQNAQIFFSPFERSHALVPNDLSQKPRAYLAHLNHEKDWISVWLPKTDAEESEIRATFTHTSSVQ
jgi:hypothetical protein